jgi:hypothetical protein
MVSKVEEIELSNGTVVRHRVSGYLGRIDGVTAIQSCFTNKGAPMPATTGRESFQYRVIVQGEKIRRIAPVRDLEVLAAGATIDVTCFGCGVTFSSNPSVIDKPGGLCECGGWICPQCLVCQRPDETLAVSCANQRKRQLKKTTHHKRGKRAESSPTVLPTAAPPRFRN